MRNLLRTCLVTALLGTSLSAFSQSAYVVLSTGSKKDCNAVTADSTGNLTLTIGASKVNLKRGSYRYVVTPKPNEVKTLDRASAAGDHKGINANAGKIFAKFKYLGWGGYIAGIQANSKLATGDAAGALKIVQAAAAPEIAGRYADSVNKGKISALIALGRGDEAAPALQKLKASKNNDLAAFAFLADGQILEKQGRKQEAIIAYLKTVLLFKDGIVDAEKQQARQRVAALLAANGDPRAKAFK